MKDFFRKNYNLLRILFLGGPRALLFTLRLERMCREEARRKEHGA